jgi:hypothetical protein
MSERKDPQIERFDHLWTQIQSGEASLDDVLGEMDADQDSLRSLLSLTAELRESLPAPGPEEAFARNSEARLLNRLQTHIRNQKAARSMQVERRLRLRRLAPALAGVLLTVFLTLGMVGVARASAELLPGDPLYPLKRGVEQARLAITFDEEEQAQLVRAHAHERLAEIESLARLGRHDDIVAAAESYVQAIDEYTRATAGDGEDDPLVIDELSEDLSNNVKVLQSVLGQVPPQAQEALQNAIERSMRQKQKKEEPPGQAPGLSEQEREQGPHQTDGQEQEQNQENGQSEQDEAETGPQGENPGRQAEVFAQRFGVTTEEVLAVFEGDCQYDWGCVQQHFGKPKPPQGKPD